MTKRVRDPCVFARQDLTRNPPFSKLDRIICRNVLIYLDAVLYKRLMRVPPVDHPGPRNVARGVWDAGTLRDLLERALPTHDTVDGVEVSVPGPDGLRQNFNVSARRISTGADGRTTAAIVLAFLDN